MEIITAYEKLQKFLPKRMIPTMTRPAYWKMELLKIPEVNDETLNIVSINLGSLSLKTGYIKDGSSMLMI